MAKSDNNILLIGGIAIAAYFLLNKKKSTAKSMTYQSNYTSPALNTGYQYAPNTGNIITSTGAAISDIINAIKGKNTAVIEPAPDGFDYQQWSDQVSSDPSHWSDWFGTNYENYV